MNKGTSRIALGLLAGAAGCGVAHAERPQLGAFIDVKQNAEAQLSGTGVEDVTYTEVAGTLVGQISNRRIVASGSYRLSYRIPEVGRLDKNLSQNGLLRLQANLIDQWLTMETGAIITRSRVDPSGAAPQTSNGNRKNLTQTYSAFLQPVITHRIGDLGFTGSYRYAYTRNERSETGASIGPLTDRFDSSKEQQATLTIGMEQSALPFDWTISSQYRHENTTNLAQHFRAINVHGDIKLPIAQKLALAGSAGFERTRTSKREALIDPLTGLPVLGKGGKFVVDPASPRVLTYDVDGLIADAGIIWRPSRRTRLEARAGYRYGGFSYTGLLEMRTSQRAGLTVIVSDRVESFGQGVSNGLASTPANLDLGQSLDPTSSYQDCLFGKSAGTGRCIGGALGQASATTYRERAINVIFSRAMRKWTVSSSFGYSRRTYFDDPNALLSLVDVVDQSFFANLSLGRPLTRESGISFSFGADLFKNGQVGASDVMSGAFGVNYNRTLGRSVQLQASLAVDASKQDGVTADVSGRAQLGLQYKF